MEPVYVSKGEKKTLSLSKGCELKISFVEGQSAVRGRGGCPETPPHLAVSCGEGWQVCVEEKGEGYTITLTSSDNGNVKILHVVEA